ncbi:DUF2079 domain-containing protein [Leptospira jelokensis]|uniref:DUF2079 domain-containing protein n=1 Tax=Leptospira jelokensis TaxID=2484931 RepID=UPI001091860B|nr:DUF2079 domain-containing protein [Leptospira jelokensis]TGM01720.1 DUF2079 domain-containing protein [Leptospira jelokensis]
MRSFGKFIPTFFLWSIVFYFLSERAIFRYHHMGAGVDIGLFENLFYQLNHTGNAITSLGLDGNAHHYFADHINWYIYPIALLYHFFPGVEFLLILQAFLLSIPILIIPFFEYKKSYLYAYPLLYALYLPIYWIQVFDFHPEVIWIPLFFLFFLFWRIQSKFWLLFFCLSLLTKEETSLVWLIFSILIWNSHPKESKLIGIISFLYFILSLYLLNHFYHKPSPYQLAHLERYEDPLTAIKNLHLFPYLFLFLTLPFLFLPFFHRMAWCLLPYALYSLFSKFEVNKSPFTHHSFLPIPILFICMTETIETIFSKRKQILIFSSLLVSVIMFGLFGPLTKTYSYRKDFMNRQVTPEDVSELRQLLPEESIVSNVPQYLSNRNEIQLFLPNKNYTAKFFVFYQGKNFGIPDDVPSGYSLISKRENHILIFQRKKID